MLSHILTFVLLFLISAAGWIALYFVTGLGGVVVCALMAGGLAVWLGQLIATGRKDFGQ